MDEWEVSNMYPQRPPSIRHIRKAILRGRHYSSLNPDQRKTVENIDRQLQQKRTLNSLYGKMKNPAD